MSNIFQKIGSALGGAEQWVAKELDLAKDNLAPVAVTIMEGVKEGLSTGIIVTILDVIPGTLPEELASLIKANEAKLNSVLQAGITTLLGVEALSDNATPAQWQAWAESASKALLSASAYASSQFYISLAADIYTAINSLISTEAQGTLTFAQVVAILDKAYQSFLASKTS